METATEKIIRLLLTYPKRKWMQKELASIVCCSKPFVSKIMHRFATDGIIAKPYKNQVVLLDFPRLLNIWASMRKLPAATYIKTDWSRKEIVDMLKESESYALTLFSAAWYRIHFMRTERLELYTTDESFLHKFGSLSKEPTNFLAYICEKDVFEGCEIVELRVVSTPQTYVDLMSFGGIGVKVAQELAKHVGWL